MPLAEGSSKETIAANIREMIRAGHDPKSAAAAAYREAGEDCEAQSYKIEIRCAAHVLLRERAAVSKGSCAGLELREAGRGIEGREKVRVDVEVVFWALNRTRTTHIGVSA